MSQLLLLLLLSFACGGDCRDGAGYGSVTTITCDTAAVSFHGCFNSRSHVSLLLLHDVAVRGFAASVASTGPASPCDVNAQQSEDWRLRLGPTVFHIHKAGRSARPWQTRRNLHLTGDFCE